MTDFPSEYSFPVEPLPTIWRVDDELWTRIEAVIGEVDPPASTGRPREDARAIFDALIYRGRSGLQWNQLPAAFPNGDPFPDDSTVHRTMQRWIELGIFERIWALLIEEAGELGGVSFEWQSVDTALGKLAAAVTKLAQIPPTARKTAQERSILVEKEGGPLAVVVAPANRHDTKLLEETLEAIVIERPKPTDENAQHLCLDKGYDNPTGHAGVEAHSYIGHIRPIGEEPIAPEERTYPPRRWVVEACLSWLSRWRGILVRYEKKSSNYQGVMQLACGLLWYRRLWRLRTALKTAEPEF